MERSQHAASGLQHAEGTARGTVKPAPSTANHVNACTLPTGRTGKVLPVCSVESQESLQPFLLPQQRPGEAAACAPLPEAKKQPIILIILSFTGDEQLGVWLHAQERFFMVRVPFHPHAA